MFKVVVMLAWPSCRDANVDALSDEQRRVGVPEVVEPQASSAQLERGAAFLVPEAPDSMRALLGRGPPSTDPGETTP